MSKPLIKFNELLPQYGYWKPIQFTKQTKQGRKVLCRCRCGIEREIRLDNLTSMRSKNCGCGRLKDYIGKKFGRLVVKETFGVYNGNQLVNCECSCGNTIAVRADSLVKGNTKSCGCLISDANNKIAEWLINYNFKFTREYRDARCKRIRTLPFDFAVYVDDLRLIEFQGLHHYQALKRGVQERLKATIESDKIKQTFCCIEKVPLLVIPFWERSNMFNIIESFLK